jgi:hypothetical protein
MPLTYTAKDAIYKAASDLGIVVSGEALGAVEYDAISDHLDNVLDELSKIIAISDRDAIPAIAFESVSSMTSLFAGSDFSQAPMNHDERDRIEARLRYLVAQTPTYEILHTVYF